MRIAFVTQQYPIVNSGSNKYATYLTRELAALGHDITVFATQTRNATEVLKDQKDPHVIKVKTYGRYVPLAQFSFLLPKYVRRAEAETGRFDIVHFNGSCYWFFPKRISLAPHVVTGLHLAADAIDATHQRLTKRLVDYSSETNVFYPFIEKRVFTSADYIATISDFTKARIIEKFGIPADHIETIYLGVEKSSCEFTEDAARVFKESLNLRRAMPVLLFVGKTDDPRKGLDLLLRALKLVNEQISADLLVVGPGNQNEPKRRAASLGVSNKVFFLGSVDPITLQKCYAICDVFVFPSRLEGFGLPLLEATQAAKPIVATNVGAIPELVENGINAYLADPNERSIAAAIITALEDKQNGRINKKFSKTALNNFSWERTARLTSELYERLQVKR